MNNLLAEEWNSDIATVFRVEHGPRTSRIRTSICRVSPITFVRDIETPMLILHSEDDLRCPITQAEELFVAMRPLGQGRRVRPFPRREPRAVALRVADPPGQRMEIILEFFGRHLRPATP